MSRKICAVNGSILYLGDDRKLELFYLQKEIMSLGKQNSYVPFIECIELNWNGEDEN